MKIDYLTITLKPGSSGWDRDTAVERMLDALMIDEWLPFFQSLRSDRFYEDIRCYSNCLLKIPSEERFRKQGICIEMTGQGVDYYQTYLQLMRHTDLRTALHRFRGACRKGAVTKCSRIDIAIDDKCVGDDLPKLDIDVIEATLKSRAFVSKFRRSEPVQESCELQSAFLVEPEKIDEKLPYRCIDSMNMSSGRIGKTIYLGKRTSSTYIRIYDKLAEQEIKGEELPKDVTSWTRFEVEFKKKNAGAVFSAFLDSETDEQFGAWFSRVVYDLIRFVDMDRSRRYNATVCEWWLDFLGVISDQKLEIHNRGQNRYVRTRKYFNKSMAAALYALIQCEPENLYTILSEGAKSSSRSKIQILNDYRSLKNLPPGEAWVEVEESSREDTGLEYWRSFSVDPDFDKKLQDIYYRVFHVSVGRTDNEQTNS
ncbi:MAG: replication initiation factor domain-containing protein [Oscillospiraceae bacterium]|nr:replication initiation factor domain-containing protein [Oscillospiraceae bacterium]